MTNKASRTAVYAAIDEERDYQDDFTLQADPSAPTFTTGDYITMLSHYANQLPTDWALNPGTAPAKVLCDMRKIAAIAVQCLEVHGVITRQQEGRGKWGDASAAERDKA